MKMHIVEISCYHFAFASQSDAIQLTKLLAKATICERDRGGNWNDFREQTDGLEFLSPSLLLNATVHKIRPPKPEPKPKKALALPTPKRGTILCICEKSYVAPKETCPHCGRPFSESHNRTHSDKPITPTTPNLRLL